MCGYGCWNRTSQAAAIARTSSKTKIKLVFGTATRGVELPRLTPSFETSQPGIFVIGELSGMGLIRNAMEQGRQAAATIAKSGRRGRPGELDVVVVGAGPAGIGAALALIAHGQHVMIVGGGNAAADCAIALANAKLCKSVSISYRRPELARLRSSVRKEIERCTAESTIGPLLGTEVVSRAVPIEAQRGPAGDSGRSRWPWWRASTA